MPLFTLAEVGSVAPALYSALFLVFFVFLFWYFYKNKVDELAPRQQLVLIEIGNPKLNFLPIKVGLILHHLVKLFLISILIMIIYRVSFFLPELLSMIIYRVSFFLPEPISRLLKGAIPAVVPPVFLDRTIMLGIFLIILYQVVILYIRTRPKKQKMITISLNTKSDRKADYFIEVKPERIREAIQALNNLLFDLYGPTNFLFIINSQLDEWGDFTKGIIYGGFGEKGILDIFSNYVLLLTSKEDLSRAESLLLPQGKPVFLVVYSTERLGGDEGTRASLTRLLNRLSYFTYESTPFASEKSGGRYGFNVAEFHLALEGCRWLIPCYPSKDFPISESVAELSRSMLDLYPFSEFVPEKIKRVVVFDVIEKGNLEDQKVRSREGSIKTAISLATHEKVQPDRDVFFYIVSGERTEVPLIILGGDQK